MTKMFATEAELVAKFCELIPQRQGWTAYHETAGWDLLLVGKAGVQIGIEAKLGLNAKVLDQALPGRWADEAGPDYRAVLVPADAMQLHMQSLALHVGITIIAVRRAGGRLHFTPNLPDEAFDYSLRDWPNWCPAQRCALPEYVPDVTGGHASPLTLSPWKIKAIKLLIVLERRGFVTRADMKALRISPTRWTDHWSGFLTRGHEGGYVRNARTPDLKAQHPTNWAQIEADFQEWSTCLATPISSGLGAAA